MGYSGGINPTAQKVPATYCGFEFFVLPLGQAIRCKGVNRVAVAADCKFPTFTQTATRFTPLQRIACPKGSTKNSNPQYVAGTFCAVGFMPPE
jgi:hypothetical protein